MPKITKVGGASNVNADRDEARRNLAAMGVDDPSRMQVDVETREVQRRRAASAHLARAGETSVTPEHQAAKADADPADEPDGDGDGDEQLDPEDPDGGGTPGAGEYDPGAHTVAEVLDYLAGLADDTAGRAERERVLDAEEAGKARVGILDA